MGILSALIRAKDLFEKKEIIKKICEICGKISLKLSIEHFPLFAEIIIPLALPKNYTWAIPDSLLEQVKPG